MISSDVIRGYTDTMILFLLLDQPSYGYEISKQIRKRSEEKYVMKETTLYSAFSRLEKNECIQSFYDSETSGKRRTYYRITEKGREYYRQKCQEWQITMEVVSRFVVEDDGKGAGERESGGKTDGRMKDCETADRSEKKDR